MKKRLAVLALALALVAALLFVARELTKPHQGYSGTEILVIEPGRRAPEVAGLLVERGVLARRWPFLIRYLLGRPRHTLKAGEYFFDRPLTPLEVYRKLEQGEVYLHTIVVPEGSDKFDLARILEQQLGVNSNEFLRSTEQAGPVLDLDPQAPTLEGYLFPDTYRFPRGVAPAAVIAAMLARFRRLDEAELRPPHRSLHDVLTLASLVEKETSDPNERALVADVFERRLEKRWPLECDPTVIYAARLDHRFIGSSGAPIRRSDLRSDSPYNTYRHAGLPPGPICNPGEASVRAALNPAANEFLYFVSNNHGGHFFARTLAEHRRNVARYRREAAALRRGKSEGKPRAEQRSRRAASGRANQSESPSE